MKVFALAVASICAAAADALAAIKVNDKLPMADLHFGFPPQRVNSAMYAMDKTMLIVGLPGAFTPTYVRRYASSPPLREMSVAEHMRSLSTLLLFAADPMNRYQATLRIKTLSRKPVSMKY